jgi:4-hydroxy-tetrahydrodipicolinate reductase
MRSGSAATRGGAAAKRRHAASSPIGNGASATAARRRRAASTPRPLVTANAANANANNPVLLINSVSGNMGQAVARAALRAGIEVYPSTLVATDDIARDKPSVSVAGTSLSVAAVGPSGRDAEIERALTQHGARLVAVDYTAPDAVHDMAGLYQRHNLPFVMGTTGGDRDRLLREARESGCYAVIAPQMGKQIVAFQAMLEMAAEAFPGAFAGYTLRVVESHQSTKKDTSGTAKAVVASLLALGAGGSGSPVDPVPASYAAAAAAGRTSEDDDDDGEEEEEDKRRAGGGRSGSSSSSGSKRRDERAAAAAAAARLRSAPFSSADIQMVRDPKDQVSLMDVPSNALLGHAFHTYQLVAPDGSVAVELQHNVVGRAVYAEGSVDAAIFLARAVAQGTEQRVYNMVDVLRAGAMR